ncbi:hypothetical protein CR513_54422, partial [Mucuna pruriens]
MLDDAPRKLVAALKLEVPIVEIWVVEPPYLGSFIDHYVLRSYANHIVPWLWEEMNCEELKLVSHGSKILSLLQDEQVKRYMVESGLATLIQLFPPVGEVTIILDDVSYLLHLPTRCSHQLVMM